MSCNTCNSCQQPVKVCCCPTPAPVPVPVPEPTCLNPILVALEQAYDCFQDQPCQNTNCVSPVLTWMTNLIQTYNASINPPAVKAATANTAVKATFLNEEKALAEANYAQANFDQDAQSDFIKYLVESLATGLVQSNTGFCCSTCCADSVYILASAQTTVAYLDSIGTGFSCCENYYGSVESQAIYIQQWGIPQKCDNNFGTCIASLLAAVDDPSDITYAGVFETLGSLGQSEICGLVDAMISGGFTPLLINQTFSQILKDGLIVACTKGQIFIGSVRAYFAWIKVKGGLPGKY